MGYESRVYIVQEWDGTPTDLAYGSEIATFDLGKIAYEPINGKTFRQLFDQPRTCDFYADDFNTVIKEDRYGDPIEKAENKEVIKWLREFCKKDNWYRPKILLSCLEALEKSGVGYSIYHYGY